MVQASSLTFRDFLIKRVLTFKDYSLIKVLASKFIKPIMPSKRTGDIELIVETELIEIENEQYIFKGTVRHNQTIMATSIFAVHASLITLPIHGDKPEVYPSSNGTQNSAIDTTAVKSFLPHRDPFLFIDNVSDLNIKNKNQVYSIGDSVTSAF